MRMLIDMTRGAAFRVQDIRCVRAIPTPPGDTVPRVGLVIAPDGEHHHMIGPDIAEWGDITAHQVAMQAFFDLAMRLADTPEPGALDAIIIDEDWWEDACYAAREAGEDTCYAAREAVRDE